MNSPSFSTCSLKPQHKIVKLLNVVVLNETDAEIVQNVSNLTLKHGRVYVLLKLFNDEP